MADGTRRIIRETPVLGGDGVVVVYNDHILLRNKRPAANVNEVNSVIMVVERELAKLQKPMLVIDTSAVNQVSSDNVRERFSAWMRSKKDLGRIGWIVQKEMHQIAVNMSSVSTGARIRSFLTHEDALKWMMGDK